MLNHTRSQQLLQEGFSESGLPWRQLDMMLAQAFSLSLFGDWRVFFPQRHSKFQAERDSGLFFFWVTLQALATPNQHCCKSASLTDVELKFVVVVTEHHLQHILQAPVITL